MSRINSPLFFIIPSVLKVEFDRNTRDNCPVNLSFCKYIEKTSLCLGRDRKMYPSIEFYGTSATWAYNTIEERDQDYNRIISKLK